ncbi:hypothetical protein P879_01496 [Paragonimus westermani]|uniref:Uncharacterized protein n=1 Tax=Paragonimus westermani TaxID=34504 RepID=A0A8T0DGT2_9TREM|nr:hypothetical protein P879_01496 [Paragonimus westermani]
MAGGPKLLVHLCFPLLHCSKTSFWGNSKYHYYGIRIKATSTLNHHAPAETRSQTSHKKESCPSSCRIGPGATNSLVVSATSKIELHHSASPSYTTARYLANERSKPLSGTGARTNSLGSDTRCNQRDSSKKKVPFTLYNTPPIWKSWDCSSCSRLGSKAQCNADHIKAEISTEFSRASSNKDRDCTHSHDTRTSSFGGIVGPVDSQRFDLNFSQTSCQSDCSATWDGSTTENRANNLVEERTYFGDASDQTFTFPKLTELTLMAGLLITEPG